MCEDCSGEGCQHRLGDSELNSSCGCEKTGVETCEVCGCQCTPWYQGLGFPGHPEADNAVGYFQESEIFPATKEQIVQIAQSWVTPSYGVDPSVVQVLRTRLSDGKKYADLGEVLVAIAEPVEWTGDTLVSSTYQGPLATGMNLIIHDNQSVVLLGISNQKTYDVFAPGTYTLTTDNSPLIAADSRMPRPGFDRTLLQAKPVFVSLKEFVTPFSVMGMAMHGGQGAAKGKVNFSVRDPRLFLENVGKAAASKAGSSSIDANSALSFVSTQVQNQLMREISLHDAQAMSSDRSAFEKSVSEVLLAIGLQLNSISFDHLGTPTPDMYASQANDFKQNIAQMMQMAQMARMARMQGMQQQGQRMPYAAPASRPPFNPSQSAAALICPKCNSSNPPTGKFCNNCGASLATGKTCPSCGKEAALGIKFCGNCGAKL